MQKMMSFMGAGKLGNNDVTQGPANVPPNQKVNKAEEQIYLSKTLLYCLSLKTAYSLN
jgi:hypothetical protein